MGDPFLVAFYSLLVLARISVPPRSFSLELDRESQSFGPYEVWIYDSDRVASGGLSVLAGTYIPPLSACLDFLRLVNQIQPTIMRSVENGHDQP